MSKESWVKVITPYIIGQAHFFSIDFSSIRVLSI